jgi:hypothetical protein
MSEVKDHPTFRIRGALSPLLTLVEAVENDCLIESLKDGLLDACRISFKKIDAELDLAYQDRHREDFFDELIVLLETHCARFETIEFLDGYSSNLYNGFIIRVGGKKYKIESTELYAENIKQIREVNEA